MTANKSSSGKQFFYKMMSCSRLNSSPQRIWINNRGPHSTFCRLKLFQCVFWGSSWRAGVVSSSRGWGEDRQYLHRERNSGAVSNDRKLSFCRLLLLIHILWFPASWPVQAVPLLTVLFRLSCHGYCSSAMAFLWKFVNFHTTTTNFVRTVTWFKSKTYFLNNFQQRDNIRQ